MRGYEWRQQKAQAWLPLQDLIKRRIGEATTRIQRKTEERAEFFRGNERERVGLLCLGKEGCYIYREEVNAQ